MREAEDGCWNSRAGELGHSRRRPPEPSVSASSTFLQADDGSNGHTWYDGYATAILRLVCLAALTFCPLVPVPDHAHSALPPTLRIRLLHPSSTPVEPASSASSDRLDLRRGCPRPSWPRLLTCDAHVLRQRALRRADVARPHVCRWLRRRCHPCGRPVERLNGRSGRRGGRGGRSGGL